MKATLLIATIVLLTLLAVSPGAASAHDEKGTPVANPETSKQTTDVPLREQSLGKKIGLVVLFGALAGLGLFVARTAGREPEAS